MELARDKIPLKRNDVLKDIILNNKALTGMLPDVDMIFLFLLFWWYWGLNSRPHTC
jgi:hypothetical protein